MLHCVQQFCVYCDSRSECYQIEDFDGEVQVKVNAIELLRKELASKRVKGVIGLGSINDPYMPLERKINMVGRAPEVIAEFGFPIHIIDRQQEYFYKQLDQHFPGLKQKYERTYGDRYSCDVADAKHLYDLVNNLCERHGIKTKLPLHAPQAVKQLSFF